MSHMKMSKTKVSLSSPIQEQSQKCNIVDPDPDQQSGNTSSMYCLKWNGFANQVQAALASIFGTQELVDVTLVSCDGQRIHAHKIILAMSSPFFRRVLKDNPCKHPIVIISGIKFRHVEHVIRFIYMGEVRMREDEVEDFIDAAESLKIDGISSTVNHIDMVEQAENDQLLSPTSVRTGVIKRNETITSFQYERSKSLSKNNNEQQSEFENTLPCGSLPVRPSSNPTFNPTTTPPSPWRSPSNSFGGITSPWSSSQSYARIPSHNRISDALDNRTDSSSSSGSPGVIVELREGSIPSIIPRLLSSRSEMSPQPKKSSSSISDENYSTLGPKFDEKSYELSLPELKNKSRETSPGTSGSSLLTLPSLQSPRSLQSLQPFPPRPTWPMEFGYPASSFRAPHYLPLSLVAASAILTNQSLPQYLPPVPQPISTGSKASASTMPVPPLKMTTTPSKSSLCSSTASMDHYRRQINSRNLSSHSSSKESNSSTGETPNSSRHESSSLSTLRAKLTASIFSHRNSPHYIKPNSRGGINSSSSKPRSRTTTIRSSQVPQSSRYTASEVDEMVERVENFPGPLVPCTICQKFVKRERLRAHIHECHLLQGESIICPHCGIGLKSKGSFRVHIWRHKRGSLGVKRLKDHNLPS